MTKTISILSHYHKSTCEVLNCSVKIRNLIVRQNLRRRLTSLASMCIHSLNKLNLLITIYPYSYLHEIKGLNDFYKEMKIDG